MDCLELYPGGVGTSLPGKSGSEGFLPFWKGVQAGKWREGLIDISGYLATFEVYLDAKYDILSLFRVIKG